MGGGRKKKALWYRVHSNVNIGPHENDAREGGGEKKNDRDACPPSTPPYMTKEEGKEEKQ